jgi:hypothetical protein
VPSGLDALTLVKNAPEIAEAAKPDPKDRRLEFRPFRFNLLFPLPQKAA